MMKCTNKNGIVGNFLKQQQQQDRETLSEM